MMPCCCCPLPALVPPPSCLPRRCVRPDQSSATVRCHYLVDGTVNFAFTMRRSEYFIPAGILLKCFLEVSSPAVAPVPEQCGPIGCCTARLHALPAMP